ncbi:unnamed protein product [Pleuronectes platessa]|uniref:Uncharacterized protein n=1 Tax=Pleuronectes platessa TaxID=8262 RepID=A0A9N7U7S5_PLEPL|nr:unnamed protein product [Pleuronectes platessa]
MTGAERCAFGVNSQATALPHLATTRRSLRAEEKYLTQVSVQRAITAIVNSAPESHGDGREPDGARTAASQTEAEGADTNKRLLDPLRLPLYLTRR